MPFNQIESKNWTRSNGLKTMQKASNGFLYKNGATPPTDAGRGHAARDARLATGPPARPMRCAAACLPRPKRFSPLGAGWTHGTRQKRPPPRHAWLAMLLLPPPPRIPPSGESLRGLQKRETGSHAPNEHELRLSISTKDSHPFQHTGNTLLTAAPGTSRAHRMRPHVSPPDRVRPRMPLSDHMYSPRAAYTNR